MLARMVRPVASGVFDPSSLNLSGWWRASYAGAPWTPTASAGASLANGDLVVGAAPSTGTAVNGYTPADFNGTTQYLTSAVDATTWFTTAAGTIVTLAYFDTASAPTGSIYDDRSVYSDGNADLALVYNTNGITGVVYSSGYVSNAYTLSTGAWHLIMMSWDSSQLRMRADSSGEATTACGALTVMTGATSVGRGYAGTFIDGKLLELMFAPIALTPTNYANIKSYVNSRYALAL